LGRPRPVAVRSPPGPESRAVYPRGHASGGDPVVSQASARPSRRRAGVGASPPSKSSRTEARLRRGGLPAPVGGKGNTYWSGPAAAAASALAECPPTAGRLALDHLSVCRPPPALRRDRCGIRLLEGLSCRSWTSPPTSGVS
jgi:hypothetical protein